MTTDNIDQLRFPIGKFTPPSEITQDLIETWIKTIEDTPIMVQDLVLLTDEKSILYPYRPEGWTIAQVVNHLADSHMNSLVRFKWGMTESNPTIKTYKEGLWAQLADSGVESVDASLQMLTGLHTRWVTLLRSMSMDDFGRTIFHPEQQKERSLGFFLALYDWHCRHHIAHIKQALDSEGVYLKE